MSVFADRLGFFAGETALLIYDSVLVVFGKNKSLSADSLMTGAIYIDNFLYPRYNIS